MKKLFFKSFLLFSFFVPLSFALPTEEAESSKRGQTSVPVYIYNNMEAHHTLNQISNKATYYQRTKTGIINFLYWTLRKTAGVGAVALGVAMLAETGVLNNMAGIATNYVATGSVLEESVLNLPVNTVVALGISSLGLWNIFN